eukprot:gene15517-biopygen9251
MTPLPQRLRPDICDDALQNPRSMTVQDISQSLLAKLAAKLAAAMVLAAKMALAAQSGDINGAGGKAGGINGAGGMAAKWRQRQPC